MMSSMESEVKVFWKGPKLYEWRIRAKSGDIIVAKRRADSFAKAFAAGAEEAKRLSAVATCIRAERMTSH